MNNTFVYPIVARWGDMDALGHINNAKYFTYFEQARIAWLNSIGISYANTGPVIVTASAEFLKAIIYPAELLVSLTAHSPKNSSFLVDHVITQSQEKMATGQTKVVWVDYELQKSIPLPDVMRANIAFSDA